MEGIKRNDFMVIWSFLMPHSLLSKDYDAFLGPGGTFGDGGGFVCTPSPRITRFPLTHILAYVCASGGMPR